MHSGSLSTPSASTLGPHRLRDPTARQSNWARGRGQLTQHGPIQRDAPQGQSFCSVVSYLGPCYISSAPIMPGMS